MTRTTVLVATVFAGTVLSGCGHRYIADRETNPVLEDHVRHGSADETGVGVLSSTASRRNAYVQFLKNGELGKVCAEPPPDVGEAFVKTFSAALTSQIKGAEASAQALGTAATSIAPLLYRSQGLQMYRDAVSHLCIDYLNGAISGEALVREERLRWQDAVKLVTAELPHMPKFLPQPVNTPPTPKPPEIKTESKVEKETKTETKTESAPQ